MLGRVRRAFEVWCCARQIRQAVFAMDPDRQSDRGREPVLAEVRQKARSILTVEMDQREVDTGLAIANRATFEEMNEAADASGARGALMTDKILAMEILCT